MIDKGLDPQSYPFQYIRFEIEQTHRRKVWDSPIRWRHRHFCQLSSHRKSSHRAGNFGYNRAVKYLIFKGLTVSPSKSSLIVFTKKRINPFAFSVKLTNSTVHSTDSCKFLGIFLDYRLFGNNHISALSTRCSKLYNIINMLKGTWWGGGASSSLLNIYKALTR